MANKIWLILCGALAGGLGWGIRGQYGHETGAMIAGLLVSCVIGLSLPNHLPGWFVARAMALMTVAIGVGGSMTYGQTIGLTHDQPLVGNWAALQWGMLGLAIKGGIWIGFAGLFLGYGLSHRRYGVVGTVGLVVAMLVMRVLGQWLLNEPFKPAEKILPAIYFSDDWYWEPEGDLKPRREVWGGLAFALLTVCCWLRFARRDVLSWRLAGFGILGGALGFPLGQSLQAYHAWNRSDFQHGVWEWLDPLMNWWNVMETTFGCVLGAVLVLGVILNRRLITTSAEADLRDKSSQLPDNASWFWEWCVAGLHASLLVVAEFGNVPSVSRIYGDGLYLAAVPLVALTAGRVWPYLLLLPITLLPIAGKTYRQMVVNKEMVDANLGAWVFLIIPVGLALFLAWRWSRPARRQLPAAITIAPMLAFAACIYFGLNFAFFEFPFPWLKWTPRTPNALFYFVALFSLLGLALITILSNRSRASENHS